MGQEQDGNGTGAGWERGGSRTGVGWEQDREQDGSGMEADGSGMGAGRAALAAKRLPGSAGGWCRRSEPWSWGQAVVLGPSPVALHGGGPTARRGLGGLAPIPGTWGDACAPRSPGSRRGAEGTRRPQVPTASRGDVTPLEPPAPAPSPPAGVPRRPRTRDWGSNSPKFTSKVGRCRWGTGSCSLRPANPLPSQTRRRRSLAAHERPPEPAASVEPRAPAWAGDGRLVAQGWERG